MKVQVLATGEIWSVWSDNIDERTYTCLPEDAVGFDDTDSMWIYDLEDFSYDEVRELN